MVDEIRRLALVCGVALCGIGGSPIAFAQSEAPAASPPTPAGQDEAGMADFFKGSLIVTLPAFKSYRVSREFFPDRTFADLAKRKVARGNWSIEDGKICTQQPASQRYCNLGLGKRIGDSWQDKDPYTGNEVDFALVGERKPVP